MITLRDIANGIHLAEGYADTALHGEALQVIAKELMGLLPQPTVAEVHAVAEEVSEATSEG